MRAKKIIFGSVLIVSLLLPFSGGAQMAGTPGSPGGIPDAEVRQFIDKYIDRYKAMDITLFMELYSRGGVENRMLPYADIRATYQKTFAESNQFLYYLTVYSIQTTAERAFVTGRYKMIQTLKKGNKMRSFQGNIQLDLAREGGSLKIKEINYGKSLGDH